MVALGSGGYCGPSGPHAYPPEVRGRALRLVRTGVPKKDVARMLGVHASSVKEWCRRYSVPARDELPDMLHEFPAWVAANRAMRGWTQEELARRSGVGGSTIGNMEVGRFGITLANAVRIIDAFGEEES